MIPSHTNRTSARRSRRTERGFTLPELLIVITLMGTLAAVLSAALTVTFRQSASTEGRANVARAESAIDTWLPADLASTDVNNATLPAVDLALDAVPCSGAQCNGLDLSGTNALQLAWETTIPGNPPQVIVTRVQYQYIEVDGEWQLQRIICVEGSACKASVVLHDLAGPADPANITRDDIEDIMEVDAPEAVDGLTLSDNAKQIVVKINGGGSSGGAGGGENRINLTAGGRSTDEIDADDFTVPSFIRAKSRCGGPVTLIVDTSGSISSDIGTVRKGVKAFINSFVGTPTQVQVIDFDTTAKTIGNDQPNKDGVVLADSWHKYADMTNDDDVTKLLAAADGLAQGGGTNWEDAFFRTFKEQNGDDADISPGRVVFFTDGIPTFDRLAHRTGDSKDYNDGEYEYSTSNKTDATNNNEWYRRLGDRFGQEYWDRTDVILGDHKATELIFVGVGAGLGVQQDWQYNSAVEGNRFARPGPTSKKTGSEILTTLLERNSADGVVEATQIGSGDAVEYTNPDTATYYPQANFKEKPFAAAMKAAALKDCGGTLTVQTRDADTNQPVSEEFVYENPSYRDDAANPISAEARRVTTSQRFRTGTFDFEIKGSEFFDVDIVPSEFQTLAGYEPVGGEGAAGWSCRSGADSKGTLTSIAIQGSSFQGFSVNVKANEAVSCVLKVKKQP
ncbi:prepilin-type N-terminal cleavage/methylation domain-containing protein [Ilumatobacter sp.]|uniref:prepilin-type N-terminal cleavage/methylation domain-containing protein n=1 Tax=Ilumatobacter sp. TaxID=1967498 RepID=UPI003C712F56